MLTAATGRPQASGKFLYVGGDKLVVAGLAYGPGPGAAADATFAEPESVERDFRLMAANGVNVVRTYVTPPSWFLNAAATERLRVMVGIPVGGLAARLVDSVRPSDLASLVRHDVRQCAGHPAVLCYVIGNAFPESIVRWIGRHRMEGILAKLCGVAKRADPEGLVTYANSPSTDYLKLDFLDLISFNVVPSPHVDFEGYLRRLQELAGDRPLLLSEIGRDRTGARSLRDPALVRHLRTALAAGCAGGILVPEAPEGLQGSREGSGTRIRKKQIRVGPKPTVLAAVRSAVANMPAERTRRLPRISVVVCTRNASPTIRDCLDAIRRLDYPDFETIVVDDDSTDDTAMLARVYPVQLIRSPKRGIANARNVALDAATGEIVAFIDSQARPDRHWLIYLAIEFARTAHAAVGGRDIADPTEGIIAHAVASSPGVPRPSMLARTETSWLPGSNVAFRRGILQAVGGFDPRFLMAGSDVDVCWRMRDEGFTLGVSPGAMVWQPRPASVRDYWTEQRRYGHEEAQLERKWPDRVSLSGGLISETTYGDTFPGLPPDADPNRWKIGDLRRIIGSTTLAGLPLTPGWYLAIAGLLGLVAAGFVWPPLLLALLPLAAMFLWSLARAIRCAREARFDPRLGRVERLERRTLTVILHLLQPLARLRGRFESGLTPWRRRPLSAHAVPRRRSWAEWSERAVPHDERVDAIRGALVKTGAVVRRGDRLEAFDLEVRGGTIGGARLVVSAEERDRGRQLQRVRCWPWVSWLVPALAGATALVSALLATDDLPLVAGVFALLGVDLVLRALEQSAAAMAVIKSELEPRSANVRMPLVWRFRAGVIARLSASRGAIARAVATSPRHNALPRNGGVLENAVASGQSAVRMPTAELQVPPALDRVACKRCGLTLVPSAKFCRGCGLRQTSHKTAVGEVASG
jgi:GT2 family glycosyltransferase/ribosomal protein L40E